MGKKEGYFLNILTTVMLTFLFIFSTLTFVISILQYVSLLLPVSDVTFAS